MNIKHVRPLCASWVVYTWGLLLLYRHNLFSPELRLITLKTVKIKKLEISIKMYKINLLAVSFTLSAMCCVEWCVIAFYFLDFVITAATFFQLNPFSNRCLFENAVVCIFSSNYAFLCRFVPLYVDTTRSRENDNKVTYQIERSSHRAKMTLKISFKEYYLNPKLNITFIPKVSTGCSNSSILKF